MTKALQQFIGSEVSPVKSLGWFGLAADPPTLAHRASVDAALGSGLVEKVVVFPAGQLSYKDFGASAWQRMEMTEIWAAEASFGEEVILSRFDLERDFAMPWIELWNTITRLDPNTNHFLIVGSDQYLEIPKSWDKGHELLWAANILIVPREGYPVEELASKHHILLSVEALPGSSTAVRGGELALVDEKVRKYIEEEGLYQ